VYLRLYGSSVNGFGLKSSDLNIDVVVGSNANIAYVLMTAYELLKESALFNQAVSDFSAKIPSIYVPIDGETARCQLTVHNELSFETSQLLQLYSRIDNRVGKLGILFKYWAKLCKADRQDAGSLPSYAFSLLTVFFLQQHNPPVLPVLQEVLPKGCKERPQKKIDGKNCWYFEDIDNLSSVWTSKNTQSLAELWLEMLKFYSLNFDIGNYVVCVRQKQLVTRDEKKWSSKKLAIEDPFSVKRNVTRSVSHSQIFEYIYDRLRAAYKYFGSPQFKDGIKPKMNSSKEGKSKNKISEKVSQHLKTEEQNISTYAEEVVEEIVSGAMQKVSDSDTRAQQMQYKEPYSEPSQIVHCDSLGGFAAGLVQSIIQDALMIRHKEFKLSSNGERDHGCFTEDVNEKKMSLGTSDNGIGKNKTSDTNRNYTFIEKEKRNDGSRNEKNTSDELKHNLDAQVALVGSQDQKSSDRESEKLDVEDYNYVFSEETLTDGKGPGVMCAICLQEGHLKQHCPEETLPELQPLPPLTKPYIKLLDSVLQQVPDDFAPTDREVNERNQILRELEDYIREQYPNARLQLFGSSCNGFGFQHSDLDICMSFVNHKTAEGINCVEIIEDLAKILKKHRGVYNVIAITTAKVPIVKFKHRKSQLEADISLYNTLAQHNTRLLQLYSELDERVKIIGYVMKVFAKICDIGDASRGSLSSYAYVLMVLYFLQQRKPPVIPVLQEMYDPSTSKPEVIVDGCNAWFFQNVSHRTLSQHWSSAGQNRESVTELWIGLLRFYTEEFNFREHVISIRQLKPLTRFEKMWNGTCIAIEDPFDLSHNLGAGLSRKMNTFIRKALINGRRHFGKPVKDIPRAYRSIQDYFFDVDYLTDGQPPNDRGCRVCGKIGHFAKECPIVVNRKEREQRERKESQERKKKADREGEDGSHRNDQQRNNNNNRNRGGSAPISIPRAGHYQGQQNTPPTQNSPGGLLFYNSSMMHSPPNPAYNQVPRQIHQSPGREFYNLPPQAQQFPQNQQYQQQRNQRHYHQGSPQQQHQQHQHGVVHQHQQNPFQQAHWYQQRQQYFMAQRQQQHGPQQQQQQQKLQPQKQYMLPTRGTEPPQQSGRAQSSDPRHISREDNTGNLVITAPNIRYNQQQQVTRGWPQGGNPCGPQGNNPGMVPGKSAPVVQRIFNRR
ncbi:terminal uridylyltransferase 4-like, partial [Lingula anatina]|uniref:Terminal uridylyltransferase 4-like n=1 Tax=Lingula anatina TaxID=7574 RepID=A0A1S3H6L0_LINAN